MTESKHKICVVGSGNWGSAIARIIGMNTIKNSHIFEPIVKMFVHDEPINVDGQQHMLAQYINEFHCNLKYLPNIELPKNVVAINEMSKAVAGATILVFCLPHQFLSSTCDQIVKSMNSSDISE